VRYDRRSLPNKAIWVTFFKYVKDEAVSDGEAAPADRSYDTRSASSGPGAVAPGGVGVVEFPEAGIKDISDG
jgi:hypothetical protein